MRRHADGAGAVAALVQRSEPGGGGGSRPGRGCAGVEAELPGVVGDAGQRRMRHAGPAEFRRRGLTEDDGALVLQAGDDGGVLGWLGVLEDQAALLGGHVLGVREVFDGDRYAVQAADTVAGHQFGLRRAGGVHRLVRREIRERVDLGVVGLDPPQQRPHVFDGGQLLSADQFRERRGG